MTIYDIAREAGVSIATVSRVMNGGKVGKATRIKVQAVLDSCDYQPSQVAKGLATRQSRCVAVMTVDIRDVHHAAIAYEIERTMATARVQHHPVQPGRHPPPAPASICVR